MSLQNEQLLKKLQTYNKEIPLFLSFLEREGFSRQLIHYYVKNNWLYQVNEGLYSFGSSIVEPINIIKAIQQQLNVYFNVGAQSALYLQKKAYYLKDSYKYQIYISKKYLSKRIQNNSSFQIIRKKTFSKDLLNSYVLSDEILMSCIERALIEMADLIPTKAKFEEFIGIMELCAGCRPILLQELLRSCNSIKAKRLFLLVAEQVNHVWFKKIDIAQIDLGNGDRQIVKNGTYNKKYKICVPRLNNYDL